jgi:hypothetical protein
MKASLSQRFEEKVVLMVTGKRTFFDDQSTSISCQSVTQKVDDLRLGYRKEIVSGHSHLMKYSRRKELGHHFHS